MKDTHTLIVGGGIIGLSVAWRLVRKGARVTVLERNECGQQASRLAAGMLAVAAEVGFEEFELYDLSRESLKRWPEFSRELEADSGINVDYRSNGTLIVADNRDAAEALRRDFEFQTGQGYPVEWLTKSEALEAEPFLSPRIVAAVRAPGDHSVDNRLVMDGLRIAVEKLGGEIREQCRVESMDFSGTLVTLTISGGETIRGEHVVLAAGAWSRQIDGLPTEWLPPVRPVKGQILELQMVSPFSLEHVIRGPDAYMVPRSDGRLVVGATSEDMGFDTRLTAGGVHTILQGAYDIVPGIYDLEMLDADVGLRPGSRDNQPIVGFAPDPRLFIATGHYRHGVVLAAVTAEESADSIMSGRDSDVFEFFSPRRFVATQNV